MLGTPGEDLVWWHRRVRPFAGSENGKIQKDGKLKKIEKMICHDELAPDS